MNTIWVIEQGKYSDYRVVGVYSSEIAAQSVADRINKDEDYYKATIAEWPLNPGFDKLNQGLSPYRVHMARNGDVESVEVVGVSSFTFDDSATIWKRSQSPLGWYRGKCDLLNATVWADSEQHAVKIVNEKRAQFIANNQWPEKFDPPPTLRHSTRIVGTGYDDPA